MEQFKSQLEDFGTEQTFDIFVARYYPQFQYTAKYVEKKHLADNISIESVLALGPTLQELNDKNFNIYIRPTNYLNSHVLVLDDYYTSTLLASSDKESVDIGLVSEDFCLSFSLLTSIDLDKKNNAKNSKKYNYQLGIEFNPELSSAQKSFLLSGICQQLDCDPNHAKLSKYFRAAGFYNKKYWHLNNQLDTPEQKNTLIEYKKYPVVFAPVSHIAHTIAPVSPVAAPTHNNGYTDILRKKLRSFI